MDTLGWDKIIWGVLIGALTGMMVSLALLPFGVRRAEWMMSACASLGVFIGLLNIAHAEGSKAGKEDQHVL